MSEPRRIAFHFHPNDSSGVWYVEKEESGKKRRYLEGVSSGLNVDGAGERMTEKAIKGFHDQASAGDVTLYAGRHGVDFTDDIGKLVHSEILPNGDWLTRYRLFDEADGFAPGGTTLEKCNKVWLKVNGLPPYQKQKKMGFSVEGVIPDNGILNVDGTGKRVMDSVELDGVVLVPRPAYKDSVARAVYKALDLMLPGDMASGLRQSLASQVAEKIERDEYYRQYYALQGAMDEKVHQIMLTGSPERADQLRTLFGEYADLMVELIMRSEAVFRDETPAGGAPVGKDRAFAARNILVNRLKAGASLLEKALASRDRIG